MPRADFHPHRPDDQCHALPKPTRRKRGMVAACGVCGALHRCSDQGFDQAMWVWVRLPDRLVTDDAE